MFIVNLTVRLQGALQEYIGHKNLEENKREKSFERAFKR